jgi:hypothetical protein
VDVADYAATLVYFFANVKLFGTGEVSSFEAGNYDSVLNAFWGR